MIEVFDRPLQSSIDLLFKELIHTKHLFDKNLSHVNWEYENWNPYSNISSSSSIVVAVATSVAVAVL